MRISTLLHALLSAALLNAPMAPETPPLAITVWPTITASPGSVRLTAMVEPHADNRRLTMSADSGAYARSSTRQLDGDGAPRKHVMLFSHLPAGEYTFEARLARSDDSEIVEVLRVSVIE